jgi:CxxC motif-containing protein (DUF1111 family)
MTPAIRAHSRSPLLLLAAIAALFPLRARPDPYGPRDPGVRNGAPGAGGPIEGLTQAESEQFASGQASFMELDSVSGGLPGEPGIGLGPRYNANKCATCHSQPALGGTSPASNPQIALATFDGAQNVVPWFIVPNGPIREARFRRNPDGTPDGGVHDLFTIAGRVDASGCTSAVIAQPDFGPPGDGLTGQGGSPNVIFRIPTPLFGAGLIEEIPDAAILANLSDYAAAKQALGITGRPNRSGNDGTITRFGWKAQNKSVLVFAAEAYNVEQGVTNEGFQTERDDTKACLFNTLPEDHTDTTAATPIDALSDVERFRMFARFLAPPVPAPDTPSIVNGRARFVAVGCALCHTPSLVTGNAESAALRGVTANLYSDLLLHRMGLGLADGIIQGGAGPGEFRTAPLWGLGQRLYFMHDGRTSDLVQAIRSHASFGSEANGVISNFQALGESDQQDVLNFLRSL